MEFGKLHVLLVHFPIALGLTAALADIFWLIFKKDFFRQAALWCLLLAALGSIPTVIAGDMHLDNQIYVSARQHAADIHSTLGYITMCVLLAAAMIRLIRRNRPAGAWLGVYLVVMLGAVVLISLTGYYGGDLTHGIGYLDGLFGG